MKFRCALFPSRFSSHIQWYRPVRVGAAAILTVGLLAFPGLARAGDLWAGVDPLRVSQSERAVSSWHLLSFDLNRSVPVIASSASRNSTTDDSGLIAFFPFDGDCNDNSGNGHNGSPQGVSFVPGVHGQAAEFSQLNDLIMVPDPLLGDSPRWTTMFWVNWQPTEEFGGGVIYLEGRYATNDLATRNFIILHEDDRLGFTVDSFPPSGNPMTSKVVPPTKSWHHMAVVRDDDAVRYYIDGDLVATTVWESYTGDEPEYTAIGRRINAGEGYQFIGAMDDLKFFGRALSDAEIRAQMGEGGQASITKLEPDRLPLGSSCPVRVRVSGSNLQSTSKVKMYDTTWNVLDVSEDGSQVIVEGKVPDDWDQGSYGLQLQTDAGWINKSIYLFHRYVASAARGGWLWVLNLDVAKEPGDPEARADEIVENIVESGGLFSDLGIGNLLVHITDTVNLDSMPRYFETLNRRSHQAGLQVHAWCFDFQGYGNTEAFVPSGVDRLSQSVARVITWNASHPSEEDFDGIHLNVEYVGHAAGGDRFALSAALAALDAMPELGDMVISLSPELVVPDDRDTHETDYCEISQFVDVLIPQLYITGRCDPSVSWDGTPLDDNCLTFQSIKGSLSRDLRQETDEAVSLVGGLNAMDVALLVKPRSGLGTGCPPATSFDHKGYFEFFRNAWIDPYEDGQSRSAGFDLTDVSEPQAECDYTYKVGLKALWYPYIVFNQFPGMNGADPLDWVAVFERTSLPRAADAAEWGFDDFSYWIYEALASRSVTGTFNLNENRSVIYRKVSGEGPVVLKFEAKTVSGAWAADVGSGCSTHVRVMDASGTLVGEADLAIGQEVEILVEKGHAGEWSFEFTTNCPGKIIVDYQFRPALPSPGQTVPDIGDAGPNIYLIPASAHAPGFGGTSWVSDVVVFNQGSSTASVNLYYLQGNHDHSGVMGKRISVPAGASVKLGDVVEDTFGSGSTSGALYVGSDQPLLITSRTYNDAPSGTYGQFIAGMPLGEAIGANETARLIQLTRNGDYRTNIGFANASDKTLNVQVKLYKNDGSLIATRTYTIQPYGFYQKTDPIGTDVSDAYAVVSSSTSGAKFFTYASVIDQRTGDPVFVTPGAGTASAGQSLYIPGSAHATGAGGTQWRSDVEIHNPGSTTASYRIELLKRDHENPSPQSRTYNLSPGHSVRYTDALSSLFGFTGAAALRITPSSGTITVTSRTYNQTSKGTYGQFIAAVPASAAIGYGESVPLIQLADSASTSTGYRANIGFVNTSSTTITVEAGLYDASGNKLGTKTVSLRAYEYQQVDKVFRSVTSSTLDNCYAILSTSTSGGSFLAYGSVVDNRSGDPVYIPATGSGGGGGGGTCTIHVTSPNGGESWELGSHHQVTWTKSGATCGSNIKAELLRGTQVVSTIRTSTPNDGALSWDIPTSLSAASDYRVRLTDLGGAGASDASDGYFSLTGGGGGANEITVTLPGGVTMELVHIPAGTFMMGSPADERGRDSDEDLHQVTLTHGYYMGKYEVTQAQWQAVMGHNPAHFTGCGGDCPVENVSWNEVCGGSTGSDCTSSSFIGRLNAYLGTGKFRLPTEAEWEYAARAGTDTPFFFGDDTTCRIDDCSSCDTYATNMWWCGNADNTTHAVGQKRPNQWGLYDVHGNVWELVADWWGAYPDSAVTDPTGPSSGTTRVIRGGSWLYEPKYCRSAYRYSTSPYYAHYNIGFRLARSE